MPSVVPNVVGQKSKTILSMADDRSLGSVITVDICSVASAFIAIIVVYNVGGFKGTTSVSFVVVIISNGGSFIGSVT